MFAGLVVDTIVYSLVKSLLRWYLNFSHGHFLVSYGGSSDFLYHV